MRIIFCLPGNSFSGNFLSSWSELLLICAQNGITPLLSQRYSCNIYYARSNCLGADVTRGQHQKPFDGKIDYDYIMWIDSDIIFNINQLLKLNPKRIVYVSCNVSTQARDLALMKDSYKVTSAQPVDMFPHTQHVENVVLLERIHD